MFGSKPSGDRSESVADGAKPFWHSRDEPGRYAECELCETRTVTSMEYGLEVCRSCNERFLPG